MDFIDISKRRVTTRQFSPVPVEQEKLDKILEAGRWAPTAVNAQPQRILVLNTKESLEKYGSSALLAMIRSMPNWNAPAMIKNTTSVFITMVLRWFFSSAMTKMPAGNTRKAASPAVQLTQRSFPRT